MMTTKTPTSKTAFTQSAVSSQAESPSRYCPIHGLEDLWDDLEKLAYQETTPFCYLCYKDAPSGTCLFCGSDDLMRHMKGEGVEYGVDWIVKLLIQEHVSSYKDSDFREIYDEYLDDRTHATITIQGTVFYASTIYRELDPLAYDMGFNQFMEDDERIIHYDNHWYQISDIQEMIDLFLEDDENEDEDNIIEAITAEFET